jgi:rhamnulokinase
MKSGNVMAVDLGASGGKCIAGIFEGGRMRVEDVHRFTHEAESFYLPDESGRVSERTYWDDTYLYRNVLLGLHSFRRNVSERLDSIAVDTWGTDGQLVTADGDVIGKVYCYRDHRLDVMNEEIKRRIAPLRIYGITGIQFETYNVSAQLLWLALHRKDLLLPGATFLPMPAIFSYYLSGRKKIDSSWASVTQLMDVRKRTWSDEVLRALGIPAAIMPDIVHPGTVIGSLTEELASVLRLNRARVVAIASHDTACAYAAAPVGKGETALIISSGTWSLVGRLLDEPITSEEALNARLTNEGGIDSIRFLTNCMGTWPVQELRRQWRREDGKEMSWEEITSLLEKATPFTAFIDPDDGAFYNPAEMEHAIVAFCRETGQRVPKDRGEILRVVFESLALKYRKVNDDISRICSRPSTVVHIVGGGCRNEPLNQFTADAVGLDVVAGPEEATALGNIMVQAHAAGIVDDIGEVAECVEEGCEIRRYAPRHRKAWETAYGRFGAMLDRRRA